MEITELLNQTPLDMTSLLPVCHRRSTDEVSFNAGELFLRLRLVQGHAKKVDYIAKHMTSLQRRDVFLDTVRIVLNSLLAMQNKQIPIRWVASMTVQLLALREAYKHQVDTVQKRNSIIMMLLTFETILNEKSIDRALGVFFIPCMLRHANGRSLEETIIATGDDTFSIA
jgi:hypothetical protein